MQHIFYSKILYMTTEQIAQIDAQPVSQQETQVTAVKRSNKEIIAYLAEKFPLCFSVEGEAKPLKIGLFQDLCEALADDENVSKTQLRYALRQYTSNWRYLYGCRLGVERVDLQGNPAGLLEQQHVEHAQQQLAEAKAKVAEKRAAEKAEAKEKMKKRPARKPKQKTTIFNKKTAIPRQSKPKLALTTASHDNLKQGGQVKMKMGESVKNVVVLEIVKDSARVQLNNGLVMNVATNRLFA